MANSSDNLARVLGKGYAYVQHGMDTVIAFGFAKMKEVNDEKTTKKVESPTTVGGRVMRAGRGLVGFLGTAGDTYFQTYDELKKKRAQKQK